MATIAGKLAETLDNEMRFEDLVRLREAYREYQSAGMRDIERLEQQLAKADRMLADILGGGAFTVGPAVIPLTTVEVTTKRRLALDGLPE